MDARGWWLLANLITVSLTGIVCALLLVMLDQARRRLDIPGQSDDARAWHAWDADYLLSKLVVNGAVCVLGLVLIAVALEWRGGVYPFVPWGTAGFAVIWALNAATEFRAWWRLHAVAELSAKLAHERRGIPD